MLSDRIIGAFTFRKGVYAEVENDTTFTTTAWTIVAVISFLTNIATHAQSNVFRWLVAAVVGTIISVIGFAIAAWVIDWVGRTVFYAEVTFELVVDLETFALDGELSLETYAVAWADYLEQFKTIRIERFA